MAHKRTGSPTEAIVYVIYNNTFKILTTRGQPLAQALGAPFPTYR
jgi:hypothetical protein